jgi:hypothetical protein
LCVSLDFDNHSHLSGKIKILFKDDCHFCGDNDIDYHCHLYYTRAFFPMSRISYLFREKEWRGNLCPAFGDMAEAGGPPSLKRSGVIEMRAAADEKDK